jgi:predicted transcriptional regulator
MRRRHQVGELQLAILRVLWDQDGATVLGVHEALARERALAPNTIGSMLQKMERKGIVAHRRDGRRYVYYATVSEEDVRRSMVSDLVRQLFGGDPAALVGHLVREEELEKRDLDTLRREIERNARRKT